MNGQESRCLSFGEVLLALSDRDVEMVLGQVETQRISLAVAAVRSPGPLKALLDDSFPEFSHLQLGDVMVQLACAARTREQLLDVLEGFAGHQTARVYSST